MSGPYKIENREIVAKVKNLRVSILTVGPGQPHRVSGLEDNRCKFLIVQGVGDYDYVPETEV